jgi:hypothetical protein
MHVWQSGESCESVSAVRGRDCDSIMRITRSSASEHGEHVVVNVWWPSSSHLGGRKFQIVCRAKRIDGACAPASGFVKYISSARQCVWKCGSRIASQLMPKNSNIWHMMGM